jgi:hypothetical protein
MAAKTSPKKAWTFMVYLAGDNNLDANGVTDLREMKRVGSNPALNVIAQFDRAGAKTETRRFYLRRGTSVDADAVKKLGETNTGDPQALLDFIQWGIQNYPAERYLVTLWNHGQGWDDTDIYAAERFRAIHRLARGRIRHSLFRTNARAAVRAGAGGGTQRAILLDDDAKDFLDNLELKKVVATVAKSLGRKLDVLGMDACLMSMAEVGYQVRESVEHTVGSEQTEPMDGWPYHTILAALAAKPGMSAKDLCAVIVDKYIASYPPSEGVTQSACNLGKADALAKAMSGLAKALSSALGTDAGRQGILLARTQVQSYEVADNVDLADLCRLLQRHVGATSVVGSAAQAVLEVVTGSGGFVSKTAFKGRAVGNSNGLAVYFPTRNISPLYATLDFSKKTGWGTFLKKYVASSRSR